MKPVKVIMRGSKVMYRVFVNNKLTRKRESKYFSTRALCIAWANKRLTEIEHEHIHGAPSKVTVMDAITAYEQTFGESMGRTKKADIARLRGYAIAQLPAEHITAKDIITHVVERNKTVMPQTAQNDLIWLRTIIKNMSVTMGFEPRLDAFAQATAVLRQQKMIKKANKRDRILSFAEIIALARYFKRRRTSSIPMYDIFLFALFSARRQEEITRLEWTDNNELRQTGMVRDVKHPTSKEGNHKRFKYDACAWRIVQRQPRASKYIFPYNHRTISSLFTRACKILGIADLRFHDLRHSAATRLARRGYGIDQIRHFTLHQSYEQLRTYVNTKPEDL
jgi:integrase